MKIENNKGIWINKKESISIVNSQSKRVTQKSSFQRNKILLSHPPAQFIRWLKSFYKAHLDINKPLYFINFFEI